MLVQLWPDRPDQVRRPWYFIVFMYIKFVNVFVVANNLPSHLTGIIYKDWWIWFAGWRWQLSTSHAGQSGGETSNFLPTWNFSKTPWIPRCLFYLQDKWFCYALEVYLTTSRCGVKRRTQTCNWYTISSVFHETKGTASNHLLSNAHGLTSVSWPVDITDIICPCRGRHCFC